jgi:hypothetical protein
MARLNTKNGWVYEIAQWYPRMCVYDDVLGWNTLPYLGAGEFYLEYGDIDYTITAPSNLIVVGSGEVQNPSEVYTSTVLNRINQAKNSEKTVTLVGADELNGSAYHPNKPSLTWHFLCKQTRMWHGLPPKLLYGMQHVSIYQVVKKRWRNQFTRLKALATAPGAALPEYTKGCIELYSKEWYEFTYPSATNVAGRVGGMEYRVSYSVHGNRDTQDYGV